MPAKLTMLRSKGLLGSAEIKISVEDRYILKALFDAFFRDSKDTKVGYSLTSRNSELIMHIEKLDVGDLRAFINSNLRLLKVVLEGLKVVQ